MIGIGRSTLYRLMDSGEIGSIHLGASRRIPLSEVCAFVDRVTAPTIDQPPRRDRT